jgi:glycosyltransferase involved in cell wall biosynthesis
MRFEDKTILIVSPESWGVNMLSKHHYALTLSQKNDVYFLEPSKRNVRGIRIYKPDNAPGVNIIEYETIVKGLSRLPVYITDWMAKVDLARILAKIGKPIDIVWNFDMYRYPNADYFGATHAILHPVDFVDTPIQLRAARSYDVIFSVSEDILALFKDIDTPRYFINHGLSELFLRDYPQTMTKVAASFRCGYVGNLLSKGTHGDNVLAIVAQNPDVEFHFIGPFSSSNLGNYPAQDWIASLQMHPNVIMHGSKSPSDVAAMIQAYDIFLIAYHPERLTSVGFNNHKVLEYLSTGKPVVSSYIKAYDGLGSELIAMVKSSEDLPKKFKEVIEDISSQSSESRQTLRKAFARDNTYTKQVARIEAIVSKLC